MSPEGSRPAAAQPGAGTAVVDAARFRLLHTMIRVFDLEKSIDFYTRLLGMKLLRRKDYESGRFTLAFVGYGDEAEHAVIELTHNWDQAGPYEKGTGFGHIAIGVPDIYGTCAALAKEGVKIPRPPGPMKHGGSVIAFVEDPDGYKIELIARG
jgi:lactoylglutathione lyase